MPQSNHSQPDISKLKIDRNPKNRKKWRPANIINASILIMTSASIFYLSAVVFSPSNAPINNHVQPLAKINGKDKSLITHEVDDFPESNSASVKSTQLSNTLTNNTILDASGHVIARRIATVSSQVTGKLNLLHIEEGQRVSKTEILAELDDKEAMISHQVSLADLSTKQAGLEEMELLYKQQSQRFKRNQSLASQNIISEQLLEDSQFKNEQLAILVKSKKAQVKLAKQRVALAKYQLNQHKIRAPFDGVVISKNAQVGELISAGSSGGGSIRTGVGTIVDMSSLEIEVEVGESYINRVFAGQKVIAKLDAYPQWPINSEVVAIIPTADRQKASIKVRVKFFESDPRILPDMGVKVSFFNTNSNKQADIAVL